MPGAAVQVDALCAIGEEGAGFCGGIGGGDDEEGVLRHGDEGLGAFRVTLDQCEGVGEGSWLGLEDRDAGAGGGEIEPGAVVVAAAMAFVDQPVLAAGIEHIAEGGEGGGGEGFGGDGACHGALLC